MIKMVVFDLDGTLTESKTAIDLEMVKLLDELLAIKMVAVTSGASFEQFKIQFLENMKSSHLKNLLLLPTNGANFYLFKEGKWQIGYQHILRREEVNRIKAAFEKAFKEINYQQPTSLYGPVLEDRGSQVTFSALGQQAPKEEKQKWKETADRRKEIKAVLDRDLRPEFEIMIAGVTSIDVVRQGSDKCGAVKAMAKIFNIKIEEMVYVGDALFEGGNDYVVIKSGVKTIKVDGPGEVKKIIRSWL